MNGKIEDFLQICTRYLWWKNPKRVSLFMGIFLIFVLAKNTSLLFAEGEGQVPPAIVAVSEVVSGTIVPETEFIGTVYYPQVSDVASEVSGKVDMINFEEGERVKKGHVLVKINTDLLNKTLQTKRALYDQVLSDLELAQRDLVRIKNLYHDQVVSEQVYDEYTFKATSLEKKSASIKAEIEGLEVELRKKIVKAPFSGVVIKKCIDVGEWLSPGTAVATLVKDDVVDVIVNVPEEVCSSIIQGMDIEVKALGKKLQGKVFTIIPQGDIPTRTFPVKIRVNNYASLIAGAEAKVKLPKGDRIKTLTVKRDALMNVFGETVVFAVINSRARMIPVKVTGYDGMMAGIESPELQEGMQVVVKGNERLRDDQMVHVTTVIDPLGIKRTF